MNLSLYDKSVLKKYHSKSQIARTLTERWFSDEMYCPCCLNSNVTDYPKNNKASDFFCKRCKNEFQLKSSKKKFGRKVIDGEFNTMLSVLKEGKIPNFFLMNYSSYEWSVKSLMMIPKYFITLSMIEKRKPLTSNARRSGWIGCNFLLDKLPNQGKIPIIKNEKVVNRIQVNKMWKKMSFMINKKLQFRGWTSDILRLVEEQDREFKLIDLYRYEHYLKELHPKNNNVKAKIRQQLQILRDNKIIRFKKPGIYEMIP